MREPSSGSRDNSGALSDLENFTLSHPLAAFLLYPVIAAAVVFGIALWKYTVDKGLTASIWPSLPWAAYTAAVVEVGMLINRWSGTRKRRELSSDSGTS